MDTRCPGQMGPVDEGDRLPAPATAVGRNRRAGPRREWNTLAMDIGPLDDALPYSRWIGKRPWTFTRPSTTASIVGGRVVGGSPSRFSHWRHCSPAPPSRHSCGPADLPPPTDWNEQLRPPAPRTAGTPMWLRRR